MRWPGEPKPLHGGLQVREDDCSYVWQIPVSERCDWVRKTDDCRVDSFVPYPTLLFCSFGTESSAVFALGLALLVLWLLYLFLVLGTTADTFFRRSFCPSLSIIASVLRLSENIAGVTILAFGNGSPDIFTSLVTSEDERLIMFTELIGAGVFVTAIIAGSVVVCSPFRLQPRYFVRDACFYILAACWISYVVGDDVVHLWEALSCILIYVLFIVVVVSMQKAENRRDRRNKRMPRLQDPEVLRAFVENRRSDSGAPLPRPLRSRAFDVQAKLDVAITREVEREGAAATGSVLPPPPSTSRPRGLVREFFYDASPINLDEWRRSKPTVKLLLVLRAPFMLVLQLCVPVVNETAEKRGWSKLLNCAQIWLTPLVALCVLELWDARLGPVPLMLAFFCCTTAIALLIFCTTAVDRIPKYHNALAFVGFLTAMLVVYAVAQEVMAVLECVGFASGISDAMLGITLLAWGNSVGGKYFSLPRDVCAGTRGRTNYARAAASRADGVQGTKTLYDDVVCIGRGLVSCWILGVR
ncbi:mitochondrial sodium/calcium exchanger protein-like isoform X1 [Nasonia vitripennis]|uniref:Sodium/calcium exchanger membrane region domain-containing protein n=1 Tax=Nasonia vitripennis TaxID=7425 RepID=A0A7M7T8S8_NASVI|nr:mitochondrial sodium/calcium exchanger protein-like isoform X1 [Nasonia vitripennis]XP_031783088.1 mitochondrial sodium/calcium exchanger protein-like isoform X1 [Nasonia vitripennis]